MRIIFLRGNVPPKNEHPEKLLYDKIENCSDNWTQLFFTLCQELNASGELIYGNGNRKFKMGPRIMERWVPSIESYRPKIEPDIIIARGGFPYYDSFLKNYPNAKKVYYGAGARFYPQSKFKNYDLFLVDSLSQYEDVKSKGKNVDFIIKPAATMFKPYNVEKEYDVCFLANASQAALKRHKFFIETFSNSGLKILSLGNIDKKWINYAKEKNTDITWRGWMHRHHLPKEISKCRVGTVTCSSYDSGPRVIAEQLACDLPLCVTSSINFWQEKYVSEANKTGVVSSDEKLLENTKLLINKKWKTREYYENNLSLEIAAKDLAEKMRNIL